MFSRPWVLGGMLELVQILFPDPHFASSIAGVHSGLETLARPKALTPLPPPCSLCSSLHTQWEDILPWGGVAPYCALLRPHALHPVHVYRWLPGLPSCDLPYPISLQSTQESGWKVLQDLPR